MNYNPRNHSYILKKVKASVNEYGKAIKIDKPQESKILTSLRYPNIHYFYNECNSEHMSSIESEESIESQRSKESDSSIESEKYKPLYKDVSSANDCSYYNLLLADGFNIKPRRRLTEDYSYSVHPSYDVLKTHYNWFCELRYQAAKKEYEKQFQKEVAQIINSEPTTVHQYFTKKLFFYTTIWPPMHSQHELEIFKRQFFQLSRKQKQRLKYLMETKLT